MKILILLCLLLITSCSPYFAISIKQNDNLQTFVDVIQTELEYKYKRKLNIKQKLLVEGVLTIEHLLEIIEIKLEEDNKDDD